MIARAIVDRPLTAASRGFTLAELLISVILFSVILTIGMQGWRYMSHNTLSLRDGARAVTELRMAVEWLRQDVGGAARLTTRPDGGLRIEREKSVAVLLGGWSDGKDAGIEYELSDDGLVRHDLGNRLEAVVATGVTKLEVSEIARSQTRIALSAGAATAERSVTLVWLE